MPDLYTLLQDANLMDDEALAYYHKVVSRLIKANNSTTKDEIIEQIAKDLNTDSGLISAAIDSTLETLKSSLNAKIDSNTTKINTNTTNIANKQDKITGTDGQVVIIGPAGTPIAADPSGGGAVASYTKNFSASEFNATTKILTIPQSTHNLKVTGAAPVYTILGLVGSNYVNTWGSAATTVHWSGTNLLIEAAEPFNGSITVIGESI